MYTLSGQLEMNTFVVSITKIQKFPQKYEAVFNIDNNQKLHYSNDAENSASITGINYTSLYIHIENSYFKL